MQTLNHEALQRLVDRKIAALIWTKETNQPDAATADYIITYIKTAGGDQLAFKEISMGKLGSGDYIMADEVMGETVQRVQRRLDASAKKMNEFRARLGREESQYRWYEVANITDLPILFLVSLNFA